MRRRPLVLATVTWAYVVWSLVPVLIAIQFSFNDGKSRSTWQGFSFQWYAGNPNSVAGDPSLRLALVNSLVLATLTTLIATPLGVAMALGLARWKGRTSRAANGLMLLPLATPEIVMGSALYLVFTNLYLFVPLGMPAQVLGHVTFSVSYVVVIVRSRLVSIGTDYEEAARDLGCGRLTALRLIVLPLLAPAVFAGAMIVFASSMDDFVISAFLSPDASSATVPIKLYSAVRNAPSPALNALATLLLVGSAVALVLAWLVLRRRTGSKALEQLASL
ncbi:ABC transporter permease [Acrocarpospora catenulata]|uniref:ABC transporter permease n=1 Tax=Acrocarpospora catenulata TaxID=2836182 RepID=UPI001BDA1D0F|nr:ABC transporter permease [Acrocarpospora catenulata]